MLCKNRNKKVGLCVMVVTASLILAAIWVALAAPETALAAKPEVLRGTAAFDDTYDSARVKSDGDSYTYTGKGGDILLGLGNFFRLQVQLDHKGNGRSFDLNFFADFVDPPLMQVYPDLDSEGNPVGTSSELGSAFLPASESLWTLVVNATLEQFRSLDNEGDLLPGHIYFGVRGKDEARINFGTGGLAENESKLTVTRKDEDGDGTLDDVWTIESKATDFAMFYRPDLDLICGYAPMPFKITYYGE